MATFPRRAISSATTITVNSSASSVLAQAAAALTLSNPSGNAFRLFRGASATIATDEAAQSSPGSLCHRVAHPVTGTLVNPTEDGQASLGNTDGGAGTDGNKTCIDWCGKGVYDSTGKKVMWAGTGAYGTVADTPLNTRAVYDELTATWSAERSWTAPGETASDNGSGHTYDGNCIDVSGRYFFKKKFTREVYRKDLTSGAWQKIAYTSGEPTNYGHDAGMDWIPSRGRLWIRSIYSVNDSAALHELNFDSGAITTLLSSGTIGAGSASVCCFNPRAFGSAGGCFVGGSNAYTVSTSGSAGSVPSTVQSNASGKPSAAGGFLWATGAHLCRDPVGDGWLYACTDGFMYRLTSAGVWTQRAQLPIELRNDWTNNGRFNIVMVPIEAHGVVWVIGSYQAVGVNCAWLYKP